MTTEVFNMLFEEQIERSRNVLCAKAKEYATADRLHNFKVAAALEGKTAAQALAGMMAKHTVSVYDMCESGEEYHIELWQEKITDHINYLLLLNAIVREYRLHYTPAGREEPVRGNIRPDWYERLMELPYDYHPKEDGDAWFKAHDVWACIDAEDLAEGNA